jgi:excisionase family DNA binding protein
MTAEKSNTSVKTMFDANFVTVAEAAALLRVNRSTIRRWITSGRLPAYRVGKRFVRIRRDDLDRMIVPDWNDGEKETLGMRVVSSDNEVRRRLTARERERVLEALEAGVMIREKLLARRGGVPFPPSSELIEEARNERTEQLP